MAVDELCINIRDAFPKARHHQLIIAREPGACRVLILLHLSQTLLMVCLKT